MLATIEESHVFTGFAAIAEADLRNRRVGVGDFRQRDLPCISEPLDERLQRRINGDIDARPEQHPDDPATASFRPSPQAATPVPGQ